MSIGRVGARFTKEARAAAKSLHAQGKPAWGKKSRASAKSFGNKKGKG